MRFFRRCGIVRGKADIIPPYAREWHANNSCVLQRCAKMLSFGAIFFGLGLTMSRGKYKNFRNAVELTEELNRYTSHHFADEGTLERVGSNEVFTGYRATPLLSILREE